MTIETGFVGGREVAAMGCGCDEGFYAGEATERPEPPDLLRSPGTLARDLRVRFDENGLVPAVVQQEGTGEVLMVAWMNAEAMGLTLETRETWFWSRSRQELWHKGTTSGNRQRVRRFLYDCDADTVLVIVDAPGPACHTGHRSCFYREVPLEGYGCPPGADVALERGAAECARGACAAPSADEGAGAPGERGE